MTPQKVDEIIADLCSSHVLRFSQREAIRQLLSERNELRAKMDAVSEAPAVVRDSLITGHAKPCWCEECHAAMVAAQSAGKGVE